MQMGQWCCQDGALDQSGVAPQREMRMRGVGDSIDVKETDFVTFALSSNVKETGFCDICLGNQGQICDFWSGYQRSRTVVERCQGDSCEAFAPPTKETDL